MALSNSVRCHRDHRCIGQVGQGRESLGGVLIGGAAVAQFAQVVGTPDPDVAIGVRATA